MAASERDDVAADDVAQRERLRDACARERVGRSSGPTPSAGFSSGSSVDQLWIVPSAWRRDASASAGPTCRARICVNRRRVIQNGFNDAPRRLDFVFTHEQHRVAADRVAEQPLVRRHRVAFALPRDQFDVFADHGLARRFHCGADRNDHVGAQAETDIVSRTIEVDAESPSPTPEAACPPECRRALPASDLNSRTSGTAANVSTVELSATPSHRGIRETDLAPRRRPQRLHRPKRAQLLVAKRVRIDGPSARPWSAARRVRADDSGRTSRIAPTSS